MEGEEQGAVSVLSHHGIELNAMVGELPALTER